ncbi:hypothetical protein SynMINOS11_02125 [Synechococcus sp. Minos11]|uniref:hypothetical protein n=1 Tax=Synechococcus sp. Minos11 TaxID=221341 RepID=UPI001649497B|nr:hypothetical protein [Synechococcus sp. Minos11]QNJ09577.1 hypothetical protein SynMINOS11_02125 [Synechococcus sp. Minos11]
MTELIQAEQLKPFDTSGFTRKTSCVAKCLRDESTWEIISIHEGTSAMKHAERLQEENTDQNVWFNDGAWFEGRFWFYADHTATLAIPASIAEKFDLSDRLAEHLEDCEGMNEDDKPLDYKDEFTICFGQVIQHPWQFDEPEEGELLRFHDFDDQLLKEGAYFVGWMDG